jgi:cytochrome c556
MENRTSRDIRHLSVLACTVLLAACGRSQDPGVAGNGPAADAPPAVAAAPTIWEAMTQSIIPQSNVIWELASNLPDDDGKIDAGRLSADQWAQLEQAAENMRSSAAALASAQKPLVAPPGVKILNEGTPGSLGAAQVQAAIDADSQGFKDAAASFVTMATSLVAAAQAKDGAKTDALSNELTEVCGACHMRFWTPGQAP